MSETDDVAAVLAQVVDLGPSAQETDLGIAVAQHLAARPAASQHTPNPDVVAALRSGRCPTCGRAYQEDS